MQNATSIAFASAAAISHAEALLRRQAPAQILLIAPQEFTTDGRLQALLQASRSATIFHLVHGELDYLMNVLALTGELHVISGTEKGADGLRPELPEALEDLLWRTVALAIPSKCYFADGSLLAGLPIYLKEKRVPERVAEQDRMRQQFTAEIGELRLDCEYGSSGLWNSRGQMISYDMLSLPFSLVRRLVAWQQDFDDMMHSSRKDEDAWGERHAREEMALARALQAELGPNVQIKLFRWGQWKPVEDVEE